MLSTTSSQRLTNTGNALLTRVNRRMSGYCSRIHRIGKSVCVNQQESLVPNIYASPARKKCESLSQSIEALRKAGFDRAVLCIADGVLDQKMLVTPDLLPGADLQLQELAQLPIKLEAHLFLEKIGPGDLKTYTAAGVHTVTLHIESFWLQGNWGRVDYDCLFECVDAIVDTGSHVGLAVYPTTPVKDVVRDLIESGWLEKISQITVIMGELVLASTRQQWRYVPKMERKVAELQQLLKSSVNNNLEIVVMGNFNTFTLTLAARLPADSISITDLFKYRFVDDGYVGPGGAYDIKAAGISRSATLYAPSDLNVLEAVYFDAKRRSFAARNIGNYLEREMKNLY